MSADEQPEPETEDTADAGESEESEGMSERTAKIILTLILLGAIWAIVVVLPETAYIVTGALAALGWQKAQAWRQERADAASGQDETKAPPPDVGEALRRLVGDDNGVLLTRLRDDLKLPNTKAVKALLDAEDIPHKAVRTRAGNGPAVHVKDIPPAPSPATDTHGDGCCCRSDGNNNTNNGPAGDGEKGVRVERTDTGVTIYDLLNFVAEGRPRPANPSKGEANTP